MVKKLYFTRPRQFIVIADDISKRAYIDSLLFSSTVAAIKIRFDSIGKHGNIRGSAKTSPRSVISTTVTSTPDPTRTYSHSGEPRTRGRRIESNFDIRSISKDPTRYSTIGPITKPLKKSIPSILLSGISNAASASSLPSSYPASPPPPLFLFEQPSLAPRQFIKL